MTGTQKKQLARATTIAQRDGLQVVAVGTRKADGATVYAVPSRSEPNRWHLIVCEGDRLACDCPAGKQNRVCAHRATVHEYLLAGYRAALRETVTRETAPLRRDNRAISIFKS